jgi:ankyrin repeat protein
MKHILALTSFLLRLKVEQHNSTDHFINACNRGNLMEAQQVYQLNPNMNISANDEHAFRLACFNGHLDVCQWLLLISPNIHISAKNEYAFRWACENGHLHVAQWLLQVSKERRQEINISAYNEEAFIWSCELGHLHVVQWLQNLKPYLYVIEYDENGNIKDFNIRSKEEANWERRKYLVWLASNHCPEENKNNLLYKLPSDVSRMVIGFI